MSINGLPPIVVSSSEVVLEGKPGDKKPPFQVAEGRVVNARVLEVISPRQSLLLINGKKVQARTFVPLQPGREIRLQAFRSGGETVLRIVRDTQEKPPEAFHGLLRSWGRSGPFGLFESLLGKEPPLSALPHKFPMSADLSRLRQLAVSISLKSAEGAPRFLSDLIQGSGLLWEKKLATLFFSASAARTSVPNDAFSQLVEKDIKGLVLSLLAAEAGEPGTVPEGMRALAEGLEHLQFLNKFAEEQSGRYLLPLPVWMDDELRFGQMLLCIGDGGKKSEDAENPLVNVSFLLHLTRLGELRADFSVWGSTVTGAFGVATEEISAYVSRHLEKLRQKLEAHGYQVRDIGCRVVGPEALADTVLFDKAIEGSHSGVLNLVI